MTTDDSAQQPVQKFGTFLGVYTPSALTILGLIMYLRFGWVVGNTGLPLTLFIVLLATSITAITALSASAVATNMRVGVGGEYYMISRSLGLELGLRLGFGFGRGVPSHGLGRLRLWLGLDDRDRLGARGRFWRRRRGRASSRP